MINFFNESVIILQALLKAMAKSMFKNYGDRKVGDNET